MQIGVCVGCEQRHSATHRRKRRSLKGADMNDRAHRGIASEKDQLDIQSERRASSVRHLQNLYSIAVTVALGFAFEHMIASDSKQRALLLLIAFVLTLIP